MRKELIFAIFAGVSIGLLIAFGAWKVGQSFKKSTITLDSKKTPPPAINTQLTLNDLINYDIVTKNPLTISGLSGPDSEIVISTLENDYYTKADNRGQFEAEIELPAGLSEININEQKLKLVYSTEFKAEENSNLKKTAYTGTVTDISSNTIQVKSDNGEIKQMSYNDQTVFVNALKKNVSVKSEDLAIGDFIVAMGLANGNKVLDSKRILITGPIVENKYEAKSITIEKLSKTKINDITMPKTWNGPELSDLSEGQRIITVGLTNDETYSLRTIFIPVE